MHQTSCYRGDSNTLVTDICGRETQHTVENTMIILLNLVHVLVQRSNPVHMCVTTLLPLQ